MASVQKTIEILFKGVDEMSGVAKNVTDRLGDINQSVADATQPFADLAENILKADAALAALATGGLVFAFLKAKDLESSIISLDKIMGGNADAVERAKDNAIALSLAYGQSAVSVLDSTTNFKKAGFEIEAAMLLARDSMDLVIAGEVEASIASEILISILKGFGSEAEEASRLVGILNGVSNNYATNVTQLGIGMAKLSPIASQMGFSFEETAGLLTPVIEVFRSGDEAAVAYRTGLLKLVDDAKPVRDALAAIGVTQTDVNGQMRSGRDIYYDVATAFKTLDDNQKLVIASQLVGIRQAAKLVIGFDGIAQTIEVTNVALASHNSALIEVEKRLASGEISVNRFISGFSNLSAVIGEQFLAASKETIEGGIAIESALTDIIAAGTLDPLFDALEAGLRRFGEALVAAGDDLPEAFADLDFTGLLDSFGNLAEALSSVFDGLDFSTAEGLAEVLQLVTDSIAGLINVTAGLIEGAGPFISTIISLIKEFADLDAETQNSIGTFTGFAGSLNQLTGPIGAVLSALGSLASTLLELALLRTLLSGSGGVGAAVQLFTGNLRTLAATIGTVAGPVAIVAAALATAGFLVKESYDSWQDAEDSLQKSIERGNKARDDLAKKYAEITNQTGIVITSTAEFNAELEKGTIRLNKQIGEWENVADAQRDYTAEVRDANEASLEWSATNRNLVDEFGNLHGTVDKATAAVDATKQAAIDAAAAYNELRGNSPEVARAMAEIEVSAGVVVETFKEVEDQTEKTRNKLLELASDERIKIMEFSASIEIAGIEAATAKVEAAFQSIDNTMSSLTDNIGTLFTALGEAESFGEKWALQDQIEKENKARERTLDLQNKLIKAQVEAQEIRNDQARAGGGLISITADGLEPELEAFMFKIIERVQVRVNESAAAFLLAAPGA